MGGAKGPAFRVGFRRRRKGKTEYRGRLKLLLSRKPRVVVRRSNKQFRIQLVSTDKMGEHTLVSAMSSELAQYGYEGGTCNCPSAYLTGLLFGRKAQYAGYTEGVLDIGRYTPAHGSNVYAVLKGAVDGGMKIPCDPSVFPSEERISGEHIAAYREDTSIRDMVGAAKDKIINEVRSNKEEECTTE
jgi:large subunit ribosomal protein L18